MNITSFEPFVFVFVDPFPRWKPRLIFGGIFPVKRPDVVIWLDKITYMFRPINLIGGSLDTLKQVFNKTTTDNALLDLHNSS